MEDQKVEKKNGVREFLRDALITLTIWLGFLAVYALLERELRAELPKIYYIVPLLTSILAKIFMRIR